VNLKPLTIVLTNLEQDLKTRPNHLWIKEFVSPINFGHGTLLNLIKDLVEYPTETLAAKKIFEKRPDVLERGPVSIIRIKRSDWHSYCKSY